MFETSVGEGFEFIQIPLQFLHRQNWDSMDTHELQLKKSLFEQAGVSENRRLKLLQDLMSEKRREEIKSGVKRSSSSAQRKQPPMQKMKKQTTTRCRHLVEKRKRSKEGHENSSDEESEQSSSDEESEQSSSDEESKQSSSDEESKQSSS